MEQTEQAKEFGDCRHKKSQINLEQLPSGWFICRRCIVCNQLVEISRADKRLAT